jgi:hypothetical protein
MGPGVVPQSLQSQVADCGRSIESKCSKSLIHGEFCMRLDTAPEFTYCFFSVVPCMALDSACACAAPSSNALQEVLRIAFNFRNIFSEFIR